MNFVLGWLLGLGGGCCHQLTLFKRQLLVFVPKEKERAREKGKGQSDYCAFVCLSVCLLPDVVSAVTP